MMVSYIDKHRERFGVEPICKELPIAPSTYYDRKARRRDPEGRSDRVQRDERLMPEIQRVWEENFRVYGARKIWLQLNREGIDVARCTVARLMKTLGIEGVRRGGRRAITTTPEEALDRPRDAVNRDFTVARPNALWVADLTYVATWRGFALDALEQALYDRKIGRHALIHHSDRGVQYVSIRYTDRLSEVGITPSVGSVQSGGERAWRLRPRSPEPE